MSDDTPKDEQTEDEPTGGERLRQARRANNISVRDVAKELHLDEYKVRALEKNDFAVLGAPVFAKGHLRKYAELVGVATDDIMTDYYQMNRAMGVPPVVGPRRKMPREINPMPWIAGGGVVIVVVAIAWWWFAYRSPEPVATPGPAMPAPFVVAEPEEDAVPEPPASASPEPESEPEPEPAEPADATPVAVGEAEEASADGEPGYVPTPGVPQVDVDLAFTGECWTEISDRAGRRLFYALGQEGRVVSVSGDAPLGVILGNAENVSLTVNGAPYPIPRSAVRGRMARLTISVPQ